MGKNCLEVKIGNLILKNPLILASGCCGYGIEMEEFFKLSEVGAVVLKGISLKERKGNDPPRICEVYGGMINSIGLQNPGIERFLNEIIPEIEKREGVFISNIFGESEEEYVEIARTLRNVDKISGIELNLSCPNVKKGGIHFGIDINTVGNLVKRVKNSYEKDLWVKLSPNVTDILPLVEAAINGGADAITCANTYKAISIDPYSWKPKIKNIIGGLSGKAIKPMTLRLVYEISKKFKIPIIGCGGIENHLDAIEYILAGASCFQLGTVLFKNPKAPLEIIEGLKYYLKEKNLSNINELRGRLIDYD